MTNQEIRNKAITVKELTKGFTESPSSDVMKALIEMTDYVLALTGKSWHKVQDKLPDPDKNGDLEMEVIGFSEAWIDPDFNPNGTRSCTYSDAGWTCAKWNDYQDSFVSISELDDVPEEYYTPTHWIEMTPNPLNL